MSAALSIYSPDFLSNFKNLCAPSFVNERSRLGLFDLEMNTKAPDHSDVGSDTSASQMLMGSVHLFQKVQYKCREFFAEFIGTLILVLLTDGVSAEQVLHVAGVRSWLTNSMGSGLAVLFAITVSGHISGAHLNPVVTLTFFCFSGFPLRKVPVYWAAQFLGAFVGAALLYCMIIPAINEFDGGKRQILGDLGTATIFATYPPLYVGIGAAVASEIVGTTLLLLLIMVTGHPNNLPFCMIQGFMVATGLTTISLALGYTSGFSLNPARDIGPRLFTCLAGWGPDVFTVAHYYALVPMFAPYAGGLVGGLIHNIFIRVR